MKKLVFVLLVGFIALSGCFDDKVRPEHCEGRYLGEIWEIEEDVFICTCDDEDIYCSPVEPEDFCDHEFVCKYKNLPHEDCEGGWDCDGQCHWRCLMGDPGDDGGGNGGQDPEPEETCTPSWECIGDSRYYVNEDCSTSELTECEFGCENRECLPDPCEGVECVEDYCLLDTLVYDGKCVDGECKYEYLDCPGGCERAACLDDPCEEMTCDNYCEGNIMYWGVCDKGECIYEGFHCLNGCENGLCLDE